MNIKRFATLVLVILFAAPFAAFGDVPFTDLVIRDDNTPLLVQLRQIQENGGLQVDAMTAPVATRVDVAIMRPDTWSPSMVTETLAEIDRGDARFHQILLNSNNNWLTFPRVAVVTYHPVGAGTPPTLEQANAVRAQTGADRVVAIVDEYPVGGSAMLCGPVAVVKRAAIYEAYAHEILHTVCLDHNPETAVPPPAGFEHNRAMHVCPEGGGDGFATYMTTSSPCGWYNAERLTGPGVFFNGVELVGPDQQATLVLQVAAPLAAAEMNALPGPCVPDDTTLCLDAVRNSGDGRFEVRVAYDSDFAHVSGAGRVADWNSPIGGLFYFFSGDNPELLVKIINGCASNGHFWVYLTAGTNLGYTVSIRDTVSNLPPLELSNPDAVLAPPFADIEAIPCN